MQKGVKKGFLEVAGKDMILAALLVSLWVARKAIDAERLRAALWVDDSVYYWADEWAK